MHLHGGLKCHCKTVNDVNVDNRVVFWGTLGFLCRLYGGLDRLGGNRSYVHKHVYTGPRKLYNVSERGIGRLVVANGEYFLGCGL